MTRILLLALPLLLCSATQDPLDEAALFKQAAKKKSARKYPEARTHYRKFLQRFPDSKRIPRALFNLAHCYGKSPAEKAASLGWFRKIHQRFPESPEAVWSLSEIRKRVKWSFSHIPTRMRAGTRSISIRRKEGPSSSITFYQIPNDLYNQTVEKSTQTSHLKFPRKSWIRIGKREYVVPFTPFSVWEENNKFIKKELPLPRSKPGHYLIEERIDGFRRTTRFDIQSFGLFTKSLGREAIVYAIDLESGAPLEGVELTIRTKEKTFQAKTGSDGLVRLKTVGPTRVTAMFRGETQVIPIYWEKTEKISLVYISTDRPVYRPGQEVFFKAIHRDRKGNRFSFTPGKEIVAEFRDPDDRLLQRKEYRWNDFGSISGSFRLAEEPPLGEYSVVVQISNDSLRGEFHFSEDEDHWSHPFSVQAYRKPEFKVTAGFAEGIPDPGDKMRARISAEYYFGGPVSSADVEWTVKSTGPDYPSEWEVRPPFEDPHAWFYQRKRMDDRDSWYEYTVASGEGKTDQHGNLEIEFEPEEEEAPFPSEYTIQARVRDLSWFTAEGQGTIILKPAALRINAGTSNMFSLPGEPVSPRARITKPDGQPAPNRKTELDVFRETRPDGIFESIFHTSAVSDATGLVRFESFRPSTPGRFRIRTRTVDDHHNVVSDQTDIWVAGEEKNRIEEFSVLPNRVAYLPGETLRLMIRTPHAPMTTLLTIEGEKLHETRVLTLKKKCEIIEIPVRGEFSPNVFIKFWAWKGDAPLGSGYKVFVLPESELLDVNVRTDRKTYKPGDRATVTVTTSSGGKPVPSEVELSIVDESIFAIQEEKPREIRTFFHRWNEDRVLSNGTWGFIDTFEEMAEGGGGGGLMGVTFLEDSEADTEPRRWFPDTLFWSAHVRTDQNGKAQQEITIPDSLTQWRITARAVSGANRFGEGTGKTITRKKVMLRLSTPRFYTERDQGVVSTVIHNELGQETLFLVRLKVQGASGGGDRELTVAAGGVSRLDWPLKITRPGEVRFHAEALSRAGSDATVKTIPVRPHGIEIRVTRSGQVREIWRETFDLPEEASPSTASLELFVTSSRIAAIREALGYLAGYPYGCVEQTMSRFLPAVVALGAMKRLEIRHEKLAKELPRMVENGLQRLYSFQHEDGGWGWWKHDKTDPFMTAYVVNGLLTAREAGFTVDHETLEEGVSALRKMDRTAYSIFVLVRAGEEDGEEFRPKDVEDRCWLVLAGQKELAAELPAAPPTKNGPDQIRQTSLVLRARAAANPNDPLIDPLANWILSQRRGGAWVSTLDTAYAVYALCTLPDPGQRPEVTLEVNGDKIIPQRGHIVIPARSGRNQVEVQKSGEGAVFASAILRYHTREEDIPAQPGPLIVERRFEGKRGNFLTNKERKFHALLKESKISINVREIEIIKALDLVADLGNLEIEIDKNQLGRRHFKTISVRENKTSLFNVLHSILDRSPLSWYVEGEKVVITPDWDPRISWKSLKSGTRVRISDQLRVIVRVRAANEAEYVLIESPIPAGTEPRQDKPDEAEWWFDPWYSRRELWDDRVGVAARWLDKGWNEFTFFLSPTHPGEYHIMPAVAFPMYDPGKRGTSKEFLLRIVPSE